jgi:hypothetical protein
MDFSKVGFVKASTIYVKARWESHDVVGRFCETPIHWAGVWHRRPTILTERRRRVREDMRLEKNRFDPLRGQRGNF